MVYSERSVTPWGGIALLHNFSERSGLLSAIRGWNLPKAGSNRGYSPEQLLEQMLCSIWTGAASYSQLDLTRLDPVLCKIFRWNSIVEHKAVQRFLCRFDQEASTRLMQSSYGWLFDQLMLKNVTLDVDSTALTRYGYQIEGAAKGYNPQKRGRKSHHPIIAMVASVRLVANMWLRPGNSNTANNLENFLSQTLSHLGQTKVSLLRDDSGFWSQSTFKYLRSQRIPFIISTKLTQKIQNHMVNTVRAWTNVDEGLQCAEMQYQAKGWDQEERIVIIRQKAIREDGQESPGKTLSLFADDPYEQQWHYCLLTTDLEFDPMDV